MKSANKPDPAPEGLKTKAARARGAGKGKVNFTMRDLTDEEKLSRLNRSARHAELLDEFAGKTGMGDIAEEMAEQMPKGGKGAMKVAEELAPRAAEKEAMKRVAGKGLNQAAGRLGKMAGGALAGVTVATPVGFALQSLMEAADAEDAGDTSAELTEREADEASRLISRAQTRQGLGKGIKRPVKHEPYGEMGPTPQQKLEDDFAAVLKKQPR